MSPREIEEPTLDEHGAEVHPAFGLIGASRGQGDGSVLFDSDIRHRNTVTVTVYKASRERSLNHDRIYARTRQAILAQVEMSEAQWASFVSSMNTGDGVPCTVRRELGDWAIPELPFEPRMAESMAEVRSSGEKAIEQIRSAFDAVWEKPTKGNLRHLKAMIDNAPSNMTFAAKSLSEYTEHVVQRARADVEAMVLSKAQQLGLDPGELADVAQLGVGEGSD